MAFDIRKYVRNAENRDLQETYDAINTLVNIAGHVTIADLFQKCRHEVGNEVWQAIQSAKRFGFLAMSNNECCQGGECRSNPTGWCTRTKSGDCSIASDACGTATTKPITLEDALRAQALSKVREPF